MVKRYEHTQVGYLVITAMAAAMVLIGVVLANAGMNWIAIGVMAVVGVALVLFSSLTVNIWEDSLEVRLGPGLIRKRFKLYDIRSSRVVRNSPLYGWGIRLIAGGSMFNVSGLDAVEIQLRSGQRFRIGTDVPRELEEAIQRAIKPYSG